MFIKVKTKLTIMKTISTNSIQIQYFIIPLLLWKKTLWYNISNSHLSHR